MNKLFFTLTCFCLISFWSCRQDIGDPLFDLVYGPKEFRLEAGISPINSQVIVFNLEPTNYTNFLNASAHSHDEVTSILPLFANITSLDGLDFGFLNKVSVRICPIGPEACTLIDEVFYRDDLYLRNLTTLTLDPGLRDVKELLTGSLYKMELIFQSSQITPYNLDCRLEIGYQAVK